MELDSTESNNKNPEPAEPLFWSWMALPVSWTQVFIHVKRLSPQKYLQDSLWDQRDLTGGRQWGLGEARFFTSQYHQKVSLWRFCISALTCVPYIGHLLSLRKLLQPQLPRSQEVKQPKVDTAKTAESAWVVARWEENAVSVKPQENSELVLKFKLCSGWCPRKPWMLTELHGSI